MNLFSSKKGYTLMELLAVLAILVIILTISLAAFKQLDNFNKDRVDEGRILIYNKAFENFRFTDFSTLQSSPELAAVAVEGGKVKINSFLNLSGQDMEALSQSGKGRFPETERECVAAIKAYTGTTSRVPIPAKGNAYAYFYNKNDGKCFVAKTSDILPSDTHLINLNQEYYTLIANYVLGDADGDKSINNRDLSVVANHIRGNKSITDPYLAQCADVDQNGKINQKDYDLLLKIINSSMEQPSFK